jgi:glycine reductase
MPMKKDTLTVVHYLNQFFGQQGGEDKADIPFMLKEGPVGPGVALQNILGDKGRVSATLICGDNYVAENLDKATEEAVNLVAPLKPDLFFAGPAFEAGRYGMACGAICAMLQKRLGIPAVTGMYRENPGIELYQKDAYICRAERSTGKMVDDLTRMVTLGLMLVSKDAPSRLVSGERIGSPEEYGYFPRGLIRNEFAEKTHAERAIEMLLAKLRGEPFQTETEIPRFKPVKAPAPIQDLSSAEIALVSDGGLTYKGNPDRFSGRGDNGWAAYDIDRFFPRDTSSVEYEIAHTGYHHHYVMQNTNRLVPLDAMRELEGEGAIGKLHPRFYSTSGNAASRVCCLAIGKEIAKDIKEKGVDGAILTST